MAGLRGTSLIIMGIIGLGQAAIMNIGDSSIIMHTL